MGDTNLIRTLGDYSKPSHEGYRNTIELPVGNNMGKNAPAFISIFPTGAMLALAFETSSSRINHPWRGSLTSFLSMISPVDRKTPQRYLDVPTTSRRISLRSMDSFQGLTPKSPSSWHRSLAPKDPILYDNESWNDPRDFAKPIKGISLPQNVLSTFDRHLIELDNQVQHLMEAHLATMQSTVVPATLSIAWKIPNKPLL
ncbi:hypothetical protein Tco_0939990 [Tanacetum coccineum]|uniref:MAK10-like protein n=1 Tax=Tanacetum coccineum TaxID=301880 RepID=A0ABQ5DLQ4_9ASTR